MPKSLDDIFDDDEFGLLDFKEKKSIIKTDEDRLTDVFMEINQFYEKNGREPSTSSMSEYGLLSKLKAFRSNEAHKKILKPFDRYNLLGEVAMEEITLDDILEDDDLGLLETDADNSIFSFTHTPKPGERAKSDFIAQRQPMKEKEFAKYEEMFRKIHKELKEGKRKLRNFDFSQENLQIGKFYLADGMMLYLESADLEKKIMTSPSGTAERIDGRTVTVFENGTSSNLLFRSLGRLVQQKGKLITDTLENIEDDLQKKARLIDEEDVKSGWIYVLKSKSPNPKISQIKDLYKIGFSTNSVKDRVKNADSQATYLFSDVEIIATYKCFNLNTHNFENLLHRFFGDCCLNIDLYDENKKRITPREWFVVPLPIIDEVVELIISGGIVNYRYDVANQMLVLK
ncbi:GIY-YIG nuclease family protein [Kaistella pullorum]|uniref:GIY-YIG nuclease family protein n=1 Tax=Kaistella pullorum TaxID=2763074 RepID=A0ABR8WQC6_9FLAO|nr:GIY-YIG nuclease family protein [Kaistella pullorum]MBD8019093.1 GIY-YIG nuclease family protein [Kaistella pullorum]